jgi:hypothetical protein
MMKADTLIVGAGPAGLFCADYLTKSPQVAGDVILVDAGKVIPNRVCPEQHCKRCAVCHVLQGIGGAGGYSDGKMPLSVERGTQKEPIFRPEDNELLDAVDRSIVQYGIQGTYVDPATDLVRPPAGLDQTDLQFSAYRLRHVGSDGARLWVENLWASLNQRQGVWGMPETAFVSADCDAGFWNVTLVDLVKRQVMDAVCQNLVMATGLSGTSTVEDWAKRLVPAHAIQSGPAGIGMRLEAPADVLEPLFRAFYDFKLEWTDPETGISIRSFCCNANGYLVTENHMTEGVVNVNGHSFLGQKTGVSNFCILAKIPTTWAADPKAVVRGIAEEINGAFDHYPAVESLRDFLEDGHVSQQIPEWTTMPKAIPGPFHVLMPKAVLQAFRTYLTQLLQLVPAALDTAILLAPEMKYYGYQLPVDLRTWRLQGVSEPAYLPGNASGYLDSFTSCGMAGIMTAQDILRRID